MTRRTIPMLLIVLLLPAADAFGAAGGAGSNTDGDMPAWMFWLVVVAFVTCFLAGLVADVRRRRRRRARFGQATSAYRRTQPGGP